MDWDHLRYFHAVASHGSLQGGARKLKVNHSTVFRRINRLETQLATRLFERFPEGYALTAAGEQLFQHADRISSEMDALSLRLSGQDVQPRGSIRLAAPDNLAYEFLPAYLKAFSERYPDIRFELVAGAERLSLTRRETDIAVRATVAPPEHLVGRKSVACVWAFFASPGYLKQSGTPTRQADLLSHPLIAADGDLARLPPFRMLEKTFADAVITRCNTLNGMSAMAVAGHGIAVLPNDQRKPSLTRLFPLSPRFTSDIWLLTHPELRHVERVRLLMAHLHEAFSNDPRLATD